MDSDLTEALQTMSEIWERSRRHVFPRRGAAAFCLRIREVEERLPADRRGAGAGGQNHPVVVISAWCGRRRLEAKYLVKIMTGDMRIGL